jgi:hypothetical protein
MFMKIWVCYEDLGMFMKIWVCLWRCGYVYEDVGMFMKIWVCLWKCGYVYENVGTFMTILFTDVSLPWFELVTNFVNISVAVVVTFANIVPKR